MCSNLIGECMPKYLDYLKDIKLGRQMGDRNGSLFQLIGLKNKIWKMPVALPVSLQEEFPNSK